VLEWMSLLEWIFITELVLLITAGLFWLISLTMARQAPNDVFVVYFRTFWKVLLRRRMALAAAVSALDADKARQYEEMKESGDVEGIKTLLSEQTEQQEFDDSEVGALVAQARKEQRPATDAGEEAPPPMSATVSVTVVPFSPREELVSFNRDGAVIKVTCGSEEGNANKAAIELLSALLGVKSYQLTLVKGHYRANKVIQIAGLDQAQVLAKAAAFA
jgi:uncharacterized protein YggU (UPF0235/DUF167 family)